MSNPQPEPGTDASPLHFTGQQWDSETSNLHYFGARHFSSQFGRFMSPDPTGIFLGNLNDPQSLNLYAYVRNNPTSLTDPSGLFGLGEGLDDCDPSDASCGGCDFLAFCGGFPIGGGGGGGSNWPPPPPTYTPPSASTSPNPPSGTSASDGSAGETNGISHH
jgi:RHS repeat-associated protein